MMNSAVGSSRSSLVFDGPLFGGQVNFYNQVSHHRIENQITSAGVDENKAKIIERMLRDVNGHHHSRGLPIGPISSIVFAELCLSDVDWYLIKNGYDAARYVDDFRIFCKSNEQANKSLYDLTTYLHTAHRLTLQWSKTKIYTIDLFSNTIKDPEEMEKEQTIKRVKEILIEKYNPYQENTHKLDDIEKEGALRDAISKLFEMANQKRPLDIGLARFVLRRSGSKRMRCFYYRLLKNMIFFFPVLKDVYAYIKKVHNDKFDSHLTAAVKSVMQSKEGKYVQFIRYWMYEIISNYISLFNKTYILDLIENETDSFLKARFRPIYAMLYNDREWVRTCRETWQNQSIWGQRAFLRSVSILSTDEKKHFLKFCSKTSGSVH